MERIPSLPEATFRPPLPEHFHLKITSDASTDSMYGALSPIDLSSGISFKPTDDQFRRKENKYITTDCRWAALASLILFGGSVVTLGITFSERPYKASLIFLSAISTVTTVAWCLLCREAAQKKIELMREGYKLCDVNHFCCSRGCEALFTPFQPENIKTWNQDSD